MTETLHPAQNRGFRELVAASRHVIDHFEALAPRLDDDTVSSALTGGADTTKQLLEEVRSAIAEHDLHGGPRAQGVGKSVATMRAAVTDRFLERNQALRMAVLDIQHTVTLLEYLERVSRAADTPALAALCAKWAGTMGAAERRVRDAAIALGDDPDTAIQPVDSGVLGRAANSVNYWVGTFGEWSDRRDAEKRG